MPYDLTEPLVIGISSRALFNLEEENRIEAMNNDRKSKKFKEGSLSYHADMVRRFNEFGKDN